MSKELFLQIPTKTCFEWTRKSFSTPGSIIESMCAKHIQKWDKHVTWTMINMNPLNIGESSTTHKLYVVYPYHEYQTYQPSLSSGHARRFTAESLVTFSASKFMDVNPPIGTVALIPISQPVHPSRNLQVREFDFMGVQGIVKKKKNTRHVHQILFNQFKNYRMCHLWWNHLGKSQKKSVVVAAVLISVNSSENG